VHDSLDERLKWLDVLLQKQYHSLIPLHSVAEIAQPVVQELDTVTDNLEHDVRAQAKNHGPRRRTEGHKQNLDIHGQLRAALNYQRNTDTSGLFSQSAPVSTQQPLTEAALRKKDRKPSLAHHTDTRSSFVDETENVADVVSADGDNVKIHMDMTTGFEMNFEGRRIMLIPSGDDKVAELIIGNVPKPINWSSRESRAVKSRAGSGTSRTPRQPPGDDRWGKVNEAVLETLSTNKQAHAGFRPTAVSSQPVDAPQTSSPSTTNQGNTNNTIAPTAEVASATQANSQPPSGLSPAPLDPARSGSPSQPTSLLATELPGTVTATTSDKFFFITARVGDSYHISQIEAKNLQDDTFFVVLAQEYRKLKGILRQSFSAWKYSHCEFTKVGRLALPPKYINNSILNNPQ
jgi:hypothetical protein